MSDESELALPQEIQPTGRVLSFTAAAAKNPAAEERIRKDFDRLNAQAEASWQFLHALATLADLEQHPRGDAEIMNALDHALACVCRATGAIDGALLVKDDASGDLIFAFAHGDTRKEDLLWRRVPAGFGVAHWAATHKRAAIVNNVLDDERFYRGIDAAVHFHTRSIVAAPLLNGDEVIGVIEVLNKNNGEFFSLSDQNHLSVMARLSSALLIQLRDLPSE